MTFEQVKYLAKFNTVLDIIYKDSRSYESLEIISEFPRYFKFSSERLLTKTILECQEIHII